MKYFTRVNSHLLPFLLTTILLFFLIGPVSAQFKKPNKPMKYWTKEEFQKWENYFDGHRLSKPTAHRDRKFGIHDGNKIRTLFYNYGSIGRPNTEPSLEWPIYSGHGYGYEFGPLIGAQVVTVQGDTIGIFDDGMIDGGDTDPTGGENVWGWEPLPGYAAPSPNEYIAMSNKPSTWGPLFPKDDKGNLMWPGQYGKGKVTADLESYFVMDDRWNAEFGYYPFPSDSSRRGLGIQVTARGYQYSAQLAEDILFFQYEVKNVSEKKLDKVVVGMMGDPHIGGAGDFSDDYADFDQDMNMVFSWDRVGSSNDFGIPWDQLGWLGFIFLESPGNSTDDIDNDHDGMVDESRFNGIDDDGDWQATDAEAKADTPEKDYTNGIDDDHDGRIDDLGDLDGKSDDVGRDGIPGTFDEGEGNGVPDPGEPDFDQTDLDESDQMGLTSFAAPVYSTVIPADDDKIWKLMKPGNISAENIQQNADNIFLFGSGYFPFSPGEIQKYSIGIIMGQNKDDLYQNAKMAYFIYRLNFQFTKPPDLPTVHAVPGDGKVTLYWDDKAEQSTDILFGHDFEGYAIYRSTDKVHWGNPITDNRGIKVYDTPIAQFDRKDGVKGTHPIGTNGIHFYMGDDTGLRHTYVDSNLINGITYYYAVTAYDSGSATKGIAPLETPKAIGASNVVAVMPNAPAAGYIPAAVEIQHVSGISDAQLNVIILDYTLLKDTKYEITINDSVSPKSFTIKNLTSNETVLENSTDLKGQKHFIDGLVWRFIDIPFITPIDSLTKWEEGSQCNWTVDVSMSSHGVRLARDIEIRFSDTYIDTSVVIKPQPTKFTLVNVSDNVKLPFVFMDKDKDHELSSGDQVIIFLNNKPSWQFTFQAPAEGSIPPAKGDVFKLTIAKPLESIDKYIVHINPASVDLEKAKKDLDKIAVVPNPYVAASALEPKPAFVFSAGRGERRVDFIHLPKDCTIRIYTVTGEHVRTIEHHGTVFDGSEPWNLLSDDNLDISFGIYIYHVDVPGVGEKIGRIAIIK